MHFWKLKERQGNTLVKTAAENILWTPQAWSHWFWVWKGFLLSVVTVKEQRSLEISLKTHVLSSIFHCQQCSPYHCSTGSPQEIKCTRGEALPGWWGWPCGETLASTWQGTWACTWARTWAQPCAQWGQPGLFSQQDFMDHINPSPFSLSGPTAAAFPAKRRQSQQNYASRERVRSVLWSYRAKF